jgi:endonuclease YncB( thermonuclease family)
MIALEQPAPFVCSVTRVHDGDGPIWCKEGPKIRVAGIQAPDFESADPCRRRKPGYVCSDVRARASQRIVSSLVLHHRLRCVALEPSYSRMVATCRLADGRDLACTTVRAGAANWWPAYVRRYRLEPCRG